MGLLSAASRHLLLFSLIFLSITLGFCLLRGILGPKFTDRVVAVNMIGTKTILLIAALSLFLKEPYLLDVCLIYALISFLAVVVLSKTYMTAYNRKKSAPDPGTSLVADGGEETGSLNGSGSGGTL
ncbi:MAG: monovalent cation/H+ antiporter complex subunit F [Clostridiales bacterium]